MEIEDKGIFLLSFFSPPFFFFFFSFSFSFFSFLFSLFQLFLFFLSFFLFLFFSFSFFFLFTFSSSFLLEFQGEIRERGREKQSAFSEFCEREMQGEKNRIFLSLCLFLRNLHGFRSQFSLEEKGKYKKRFKIIEKKKENSRGSCREIPGIFGIWAVFLISREHLVLRYKPPRK